MNVDLVKYRMQCGWPICRIFTTALALLLIATPATCFVTASEVTAVGLLEHRCLSCHNDVDRKGDLSFETVEQFHDAGLIDADNTAASHLLTVITSQDGDPPDMPKGDKPLSRPEVEILRHWLDEGAPWPEGYRLQQPQNDDFDWWSFQPVVRPPVPEFDPGSPEADWVRNSIDAFIAAKHEQRGLQPAAPADKLPLLRRVYFDLTGLPPTPEQVDLFLEDKRPEAFAEVIESLLRSERYGERWARHWLDVVKYADTCGYDKDKLRPHAWPYRDYVIESFNADKPWTRFVQEQIAGDVLFPGEPDGIRALGFIAAGPWDFIGHAEVSEDKIDGKVARNLDRDDMVSNTLNAFCSVTIQCARCHNHKFDPFTQEHYYSLQSVFAAVDKADRVYDTNPETERQRHRLTEQLREATEQLKAHDERIEQAGADELQNLTARVEASKDGRREASRPIEYGYHSEITQQATDVKWVEVDLGQPVVLQEIRLRACADDFNSIGPGFGFPQEYRIEGTTSESITDAADTKLFFEATQETVNPGLAVVKIAVNGPPVRCIRVTATRLAERKDDFILALAELEAMDANGVNLALHAKVTALDSVNVTQRWANENLTDGRYPVAEHPDQADEHFLARSKRQDLLSTLRTEEWRTEQQRMNRLRDDLKKQLDELPGGQLVYAAATNFKSRGAFRPTMGKPRQVRLLHRGNVTQPMHEVRPGVVPLHAEDVWQLPLEEGHVEADRRVALAHWLTRGDHPLTWRSVVNRVWQYHFGEPLVKSPNDFGRMGQQPSHPELLDWLAAEFRDNGQSLKHLHRLILSSAAWQQSSLHNSANAAIDSSNRFLWRQTRRRLSAEEVRDSVLQVSGRLNLEMGGPGYYLFVLEKTDHSPHYEYHKFDPADEASHRRSIYRFIVRSQPDPFMTTMDCADSSQSTPVRTETFTPLQALSLLNNDFTLVMSDHFADRLRQGDKDAGGQVEQGFRLCTGRSPTDEERATLVEFREEHGGPALARLLFNLNEFIFVD